MQVTVKELRALVAELLDESVNSPFDKHLVDDDAFKKKSVLVPGDIKRSISSWSRSMNLSGHKRKRKR